MSNPYSGKPDHCFWSRAVAAVGPGMLDPMVGTFRIEAHEKVATMGSCFAQHLARHLSTIGLNYYVEERAPTGMDDAEARRRNYGVFSGRYGNVYTVRQALQLFQRAFGDFKPAPYAWPFNGGFVDAFRPQIEPEPYSDMESLGRAQETHLMAVRRVFQSADWIIFTLGLTEAWVSRSDGAVYPMAPGVHGGDFDAEEHQFVNFSVQEVIEDLRSLIRLAVAVNPKVKFILTVSPVPLIATYEERHVLTSTTCSKSALRVAADAAEREFDNVIYFPSYEIITSPVIGSYFMDDLREVSPLGVKHVMRVFSKHFTEQGNRAWAESSPVQDLRIGGRTDVVCDEEEIERALVRSGIRRA